MQGYWLFWNSPTGSLGMASLSHTKHSLKNFRKSTHPQIVNLRSSNGWSNCKLTILWGSWLFETL
jgi:hypothetical protein